MGAALSTELSLTDTGAVTPAAPVGAYPSTSRRARQLLELASAAVPFCAWVLGYRDAHTGRMRPLVQAGYRPEVVDFIFGDFTAHPLVRRLMTQPGTAYFWEDVAGFADDTVAREVLRPCGFAEGTSVALRGTDGQPVGVAHLSLPEPYVPANARAVLASLSPALGDLAAATARASALGLTPRELEILGLLARGHTNPQVCAELVLSRSTVGTHVEHILTKMGVTTRVEAVATAIGLGLVET
ncbi:LuxR C-terminal-related transcriptional regulator [Nocardioides carbamazepini]|uniref:helix-turn-helix transcriptional regulator n=1 Tax=Nocardioides carbamazepini TaxID=2854259 RepID=UPI00214A5729|nr:LuxR C-terminal-related transcriptional regulator [Nocardioides carbamazepini]MCR1782179.1 LuxR C-terminal-related transcriptional regulator [Nocardioides carbamazepini]